MATDGEFVELATGKGGTIKVLKAMHPRARRLRLSVTSRGARISYPRGTHPAELYAFLRQNSGWLERKLSEMGIPRREPPPLHPGVPTRIPLRGESVDVTWCEGEYPRIEDLGTELRLHLPRPFTTAMPAVRSLFAAFLETRMRHDLSRWMSQGSERLGAAPTGLRIKPLKSLWGSLDAHDRITLDLALALAPPPALHYVLAHELSHLRVRSHSRQFWACVGGLMPAYQAQRDWLREHGAILKTEMDRLTGRGR